MKFTAALLITLGLVSAAHAFTCNGCEHQDFSPVCGVNNITYDNQCHATKCIGIDIMHIGECTSEDIPLLNPKENLDLCSVACASQSYAPCVGSDGKTYDNLCQVDCHGVSCGGNCCYNEAHLKPEVEDLDLCTVACASQSYSPCAGSDGKTYDNLCQVDCHSVSCGGNCCYNEAEAEVKPEVEDIDLCSVACASQSYAPCTGSDGKTYDNLCQVDCHNVSCGGNCCYNKDFVFPEPDVEEVLTPHEDLDLCQVACASQMYSPCVGSDGKTYDNLCQVDCHSVSCGGNCCY
jgi:hypothetical protein